MISPIPRVSLWQKAIPAWGHANRLKAQEIGVVGQDHTTFGKPVGGLLFIFGLEKPGLLQWGKTSSRQGPKRALVDLARCG
jgi:hypothetical protein